MASFLVPLNDEESLKMWQEFKKLAHREEKPAVELVREILRDHLKKHGDGNPNFSLEKWGDPDFRAFPTMGEILRPEVLNKYSYDSLEEIAKAARARAWEISQEIKKRGEFFHWKLGN